MCMDSNCLVTLQRRHSANYSVRFKDTTKDREQGWKMGGKNGKDMKKEKEGPGGDMPGKCFQGPSTKTQRTV